MKITKIHGADICRDGGSYSFSFDADDGQWYEIFMRTKAFEKSDDDYYPTALYRGGYNGGELIKNYTWEEANKYLATIKYENTRFKEYLKIVSNYGKNT